MLILEKLASLAVVKIPCYLVLLILPPVDSNHFCQVHALQKWFATGKSYSKSAHPLVLEYVLVRYASTRKRGDSRMRLRIMRIVYNV